MKAIVFSNAITPLPETAPAHAAMFTGIHPVRTGVLSNGHSLHKRYRTLAEHLEKRVGRRPPSFPVLPGFKNRVDQGFQAYDDDFFPACGASPRFVLAVDIAGHHAIWDPMQFRTFLERPAENTLGLALEWVRITAIGPSFCGFTCSNPTHPTRPTAHPEHPTWTTVRFWQRA